MIVSPDLEPVLIDDPADPRIEAFRDIRERDLVGRGGFIAEGVVVVEQLLASTRFRPSALLVLRGRWSNLRGRIADWPQGVPIYLAEPHVFDRIAGFPVHRGVLAHGEHTAASTSLDLQRLARRNALVVAACGIANHDNMGAIFRNAAAFGVNAVVLDDECCDPLYRKAIRVSVGAVLNVPFARLGADAEMVARLIEAGFTCVALSPRGEQALHDWRPLGPTALILGAEGPGLSRKVMDRILALRIAMAPGLDSLNVATAGAIALHHVYAWRSAPG